MRKMKSALALFIIIALFATGCGEGEINETATNITEKSQDEQAAGSVESDIDEESTIKEPVTIHLAGSDTGLPNPFKHFVRGPGLSKMQLLYDSLMEKDENGEIPWLAKSWDVSEDGKTITFQLQDNILWHDMIPMTSEDIAFTFDYYKKHPPVSNDLLVNGEYIVKSTKTIDEKTIEIQLTSFDNSFLRKIGFTRIIPKHVWENVEDPTAYEEESATIGSGPYKLDTYDPQQGMYRYVAFDQYWGLAPALAAIEWIPVSDEILAFENGEIDLTTTAPDIVKRYKEDETVEVKEVYSYHSYRLMMNMESVDSLQDINVRKALAYGINIDELMEKIARGSALQSSIGYVPSVSPWYNEAITQYNHYAAKAKELLGGHTYSFKLLTANSAEEVKVAELMKLTLAEIGIELQIESVEKKTRDQAVKSGEYELLLIYAGGMGGDPDYLRSIYCDQTTGAAMSLSTIKGYKNERLQELGALQAVERDQSIRKEMIFEMQQIISEDVPMIMLFGNVDLFIYRPEVYNGWMGRYDHNKLDHNKLSYLVRE